MFRTGITAHAVGPSVIKEGINEMNVKRFAAIIIGSAVTAASVLAGQDVPTMKRHEPVMKTVSMTKTPTSSKPSIWRNVERKMSSEKVRAGSISRETSGWA